MKFGDKLIMLRKKNNITQESLADKLNISRQAVSKWENGTSMPDMQTIMDLCGILNCGIEDLIDDQAIGNKIHKEEKININNYLKEGLSFITKTYNMFCSMSLKEKIKCILEVGLLTLILYLIWLLIGNILLATIDPILSNFPGTINGVFYSIMETIYVLIGVISSLIVIIHLFKIRYLDYFVTIEDSNVKTKTVEDAIDENKEKIIKEEPKHLIVEKPKEKIIIRDPKHSSYHFLSGLGKIVIFFCKAVAIFIGLLALISFLILTFSFFVTCFYIHDGLIFIGIGITILSLCLLNFLIIYLLFAFIVSHKPAKIWPIASISSFILLSLGGAITFLELTDFKYIESLNDTTETTTTTTYIEASPNTIISFLDHHNVDVIIDEKINDIKVDIISLKNQKVMLHHHRSMDKDYFCISYDGYFLDDFKLIINALQNKEWYDFDLYQIKITTNSQTYKLLQNNL